ncbi:MAG: response regulator [Planctomycetaceae bacterium]|jgi:signal transduction histidine kinase/CheY-like chemotaxis protein|nr:response regulator [Planctomycetaceae bacterium]
MAKVKYSIRFKLLMFIAVPIVLIYGMIAVLQIFSEMDIVFNQTYLQLSETTSAHAAACDAVFTLAAKSAEGLARYIETDRPDTAEEITNYITHMLQQNDNIIGSAVAFVPGGFPQHGDKFSPYLYKDPQGQIHYKDLAQEYDYITWEWYSEPMKSGQPCWSEPYFDDGGGEVFMCTYSVPVLHNKRIIAIATIDISLDGMKKIVNEVAQNESIRCFLVSKKGMFIVATGFPDWEMKVTLDSAAQRYSTLLIAKDKLSTGQQGHYRVFSKVTNRDEIAAHTLLPNIKWGFVEFISESSVLQPIYSHFLRQMVFVGAGFSLIVLLLFLVARQITKPLDSLMKFAGELSRGNLDTAVVKVNSRDEIQRLAEVFNEMVVSLKNHIEENIRVRTEAAEAKNKAKIEFLTIASHELRTPISGLIGAADILLQSPLDTRQREMVTVQKSAALTLLTHIANIMDCIQRDTSGILLQNHSFLLKELFESIRPILEFRAKIVNVETSIHYDDRIQNPVLGDSARLRHILLNLLDNAMKFSSKANPQGKVQLRAVLAAAPVSSDLCDAEQRVRFEVIDNGIGLTKELQQRILLATEWSQDTVHNWKSDGLGLGCLVSWLNIQAMHGTIGIDSEYTQGASFWFEIPLPVCEEHHSCTVPHRVIRVLVAEDNRINQMIIRQMLEKAGYEVTVAENGQKAFDEWLRGWGPQEHHFDVILMDCQMPEVDGYEASRMIRRQEKVNGTVPIPIIAVTANTVSGDRERCLGAGMDDYCNKPVNPQMLSEKIEMLVNKTQEN